MRVILRMDGIDSAKSRAKGKGERGKGKIVDAAAPKLFIGGVPRKRGVAGFGGRMYDNIQCGRCGRGGRVKLETKMHEQYRQWPTEWGLNHFLKKGCVYSKQIRYLIPARFPVFPVSLRKIQEKMKKR